VDHGFHPTESPEVKPEKEITFVRH
jgi:hypothetical protein